MKRILIAIMSIVLVAGLTGGAFAYFSATEEDAANTYTAGTLTMEVNTGDAWTIDIGPMAPGTATTPVEIPIENTGNLTGDLYMKITPASTSGISTLITVNCEVDSAAVTDINGVLLSAQPSTYKLASADMAGSDIVTLSLGGLLDGEGTDNSYQGLAATFTVSLYLAQDGQTPS